MPYRVEYTSGARRQLRGLDSAVQRRIFAKSDSLAGDPRPHGCVKLSGEEQLWRIRVGDYRIVYEVHDHDSTVLIAVIAHRREVYRDL